MKAMTGLRFRASPPRRRCQRSAATAASMAASAAGTAAGAIAVAAATRSPPAVPLPVPRCELLRPAAQHRRIACFDGHREAIDHRLRVREQLPEGELGVAI